MKENSVLSVLVGYKRYAFNITDVLNILDADTYKEVEDGYAITGIAETPEAIVPVVDMSLHLDLEPLKEVKYKSIILVRQYTAETEFEMGLLVDSVNGTYDIYYNEENEIVKISDDLDRDVPLRDLSLLDPHSILNRDERILALTKFYRRITPVESKVNVHEN